MLGVTSCRHSVMLIGRHVVRILLGIIFIYAGFSKIIHPEAFAGIIANYRILPSNLVSFSAVLLPWLEVTAGVSLLIGYGAKGGALIIDILMIVFILAFIANLVRGIDVACGCFSVALMEKTSTYSYLIRDVLLLAAGVSLLVCEIKKQ